MRRIPETPSCLVYRFFGLFSFVFGRLRMFQGGFSLRPVGLGLLVETRNGSRCSHNITIASCVRVLLHLSPPYHHPFIRVCLDNAVAAGRSSASIALDSGSNAFPKQAMELLHGALNSQFGVALDQDV